MTVELTLGNQAVNRFMPEPLKCNICKTRLDETERRYTDNVETYLCNDCRIVQSGVLNPPTHKSKCLTCGTTRDVAIGYINNAIYTYESFAKILEEQTKELKKCETPRDLCSWWQLVDPPFQVWPLENATLRYMGGPL